MNRKSRGWLFVVAIIYLFVVQSAAGIRQALAVTPTPTNTATPPGYNNNSNFSVMVDNNAALPWPLPALPGTPAPSATATLYNATPPHATGYAGQLATTTAQVGAFTGPVNNISTPVAAMIGSGPTPVGAELNTGVDMGSGTITFVGFAEDIGDTIGPVVGIGKAFVLGLAALGSYSPMFGIIVGAQITALIIAAFLQLLPMIIKAGQWLIDFVIRLFTLIGSWIPGT